MSNKVKIFVANQALVREVGSCQNPVPLLANHKKFIRSAFFLINKNSGQALHLLHTGLNQSLQYIDKVL